MKCVRGSEKAARDSDSYPCFTSTCQHLPGPLSFCVTVTLAPKNSQTPVD